MRVQIDERIQLRQHVSKRPGGIKYIVIHDTGNPGPYAGALTHKRYFTTTSRKASADYVVDDQRIIQLNDWRQYYTWHCGDGKGRFGIRNDNSIGIEMCIDSTGDIRKTTDRTLALTADLMQELQIDLDHVVRHYDASRKMCPGHMQASGWAQWATFKRRLAKIVAGAEDAPPKVTHVKVQVTDGSKIQDIDIPADFAGGHHYVLLRDVYEAMGYSVSWDGERVHCRR